MKKPKQTCRQALESQGISIFPAGEGEFVAYKPKLEDGSIDMDFEMEDALEALSFFDYEKVAMGRAFYVMGDVDSPV